ncbi:MAG: UDP-N-acetylmuramoyl-L-alanyl-D-glutamate--2,6-diaminopimelate ligase [Eubacteriales bacterium]|nr:UDP-N-acetylmuramoyl-L-alanyl-D-glutamate--2,6-diaminopimelate ligase [Eubacteriales bacterium]
MKLGELLRNLDMLDASAAMDMEIGGVSYDSRKTQPGDLFVAIRGFESDGHKFIPAAMARGAAAVLCEEAPSDGTPYVRVADCRKGLAYVSREFFGDPAKEMTLIGITGTSGKTTSSYLIKHMLEMKLDAKVGLIGTNGNMIGSECLHSDHTTPESYELHKLFRRMADEGCTHVVMEVSSHALALERVAGIEYDVGVYTNLSQDHLDLHGTMEEYAAAKRLLFRQCKLGCLNADDKWTDFMLNGATCKAMTFSAESDSADLTAKDIRLSATGVRFAAVYKDELALTRLAIPGNFSVHNALGAIAVGLSLGISLADCCDAMASAKGVKGRVEVVPTDGDYSIIIDYSHKPGALETVLQTLRPVVKGRLVCLFGCGGDRDKVKRPIMGAIAADNSDFVIVTSDNPRTEEPEEIIREIVAGMKNKRTPKKVICDREEAIHWAIDNARPGDVILLAGKGHEDYQVVGHEKRHMDEREIVADWLEKRKQRG